MDVAIVYLIGIAGITGAYLYVFFNRFNFFRKNVIGRLIPFVVSLSGVALIVYAHVRLSMMTGLSSSSLLRMTGIILFAMGGLTYALCWELAFFVKGEGPYSKNIYTKGIYALCRNPQILALNMAILGQMFFVPSFLTWGFCIVNMILFYGYILLEEKFEMLPSFGDEFQEYKKRTPRLMPSFNSVRECIATFGGR